MLPLESGKSEKKEVMGSGKRVTKRNGETESLTPHFPIPLEILNKNYYIKERRERQ